MIVFSGDLVARVGEWGEARSRWVPWRPLRSPCSSRGLDS